MIERDPNIVNMVFGSHLYGLDTEHSDVDYKGIYVPTVRELVTGDYPGTYKASTGGLDKKNKPGDHDYEVISLGKFIKLACKGETFAIDMLHCDNPVSTSPIWEEMVSMRTKFYSSSMVAYLGYVKKQAAKYGIKGSRVASMRGAAQRLRGLATPTDKIFELDRNDVYADDHSGFVVEKGREFYEVCGKKYELTCNAYSVVAMLGLRIDKFGARALLAEKNEGVDWKALSHALRAGYQVRDIFLLGDYNYPLDENQFILDVKLGKLDYTTEVAPVLEDLIDQVNYLSTETTLPTEVDAAFWENWLVEKIQQLYKIDLT